MFFKKISFFICFTSWFIFSCTTNQIKLPVISTTFLEKEHSTKIKLMSFKNQLNNAHSPYHFKGKVHLVNFFFVSCSTICPVMENNLKTVIKSNKNIAALSYTIDPERDSLSILRKHHRDFAEKASNWFFLRGNKKEIKELARYYLSYVKNEGTNDSYFYHTSSVVLLDKKMRIRGIYDSLEKEEILLLERDIQILLKE